MRPSDTLLNTSLQPEHIAPVGYRTNPKRMECAFLHL
jgi:hypothetical protein